MVEAEEAEEADVESALPLPLPPPLLLPPPMALLAVVVSQRTVQRYSISPGNPPLAAIITAVSPLLAACASSAHAPPLPVVVRTPVTRLVLLLRATPMMYRAQSILPTAAAQCRMVHPETVIVAPKEAPRAWLGGTRRCRQST
jgi:hypothetical protein